MLHRACIYTLGRAKHSKKSGASTRAARLSPWRV